MRTKRMLWIIGVCAVVVVFVASQLLWLRFSGSKILAPQINREPMVYGSGEPLNLVVLGDSVGVGQGATYNDGVAVTVAAHLATNRQVTLYNFAVSGARTADVVTRQLPQLSALAPDVALLIVGSNDVIHATKLANVRRDLRHIFEVLQAANPDIQIVVTGAGALGTSPRIPWPTRVLAGWESDRVNLVFAEESARAGVTWADIAARTQQQFAHGQDLLAADKFHPNRAGYKLWSQAIIESIK